MANPSILTPSTLEHLRNLGFNLAAIVLVLALVGIGIAYKIDDWSRDNQNLPSLRTAGPTISKTIGGQQLAIPPAWFKSAEQRNQEFSERIDLIFALPLGTNGRTKEIGVSLQPLNLVRSSARLLDAVYLHQFMPQQIDGPIGLVGKPLKNAEGYQNETVWYDPLLVEPFVAKCIKSIVQSASADCVRIVPLNAQIAATYTFDQEVLAQWKRFDAEAALWLNRIGGI